MKLKSALGLVRRAGADLMADDAITLGAALAFYTSFSLAPLMVLLIWFTSLLGGAAQQELIDQMAALVGEQGGEAIHAIVESAEERPALGSVAGATSLFVLLFSAATVFAQLQHSLNIVFDVKTRPATGALGGVWAWLRRRLLSMGMVVSIGFLLLVSLAVSAGVAALLGSAREGIPAAGLVWAVTDVAAPFLVFVAVFAVLFKFLPDVRIAWRDVGLASVITAALFVVGKAAIGLYLGRSTLGSAYGAAGSLVVLLVWVFYSTIIFFFGAELAQVWARAHGRGFAPKEGVELAEPR